MPAKNLKFFIAILFFAFCTSGCSKQNKTIEPKESETIESIPGDNATCTIADGDGMIQEYNCLAGHVAFCDSEIKPNTPIEALNTSGYYWNCWRYDSGVLPLARRGVAILPILIGGLYEYPENPILLDIIIKMGPDAADTAPHLFRLLEKNSENAELKRKIQSAFESLGEGGTTAIPYLINRLNELRKNQGSSQDIDETISYLVQFGQFKPSLVKPTLIELTKDKNFSEAANNALILIKYPTKISAPSSGDSKTFGAHKKYCQEIYDMYSKTPKSRQPDPDNQQQYGYCIAELLGGRGVEALPELIKMANSEDIYLRYLAVKYIGALGDAVDSETREKIIALKDKKYGRHGDFSMDWDVNYYMLGQFPEFRN